VVVRCVGFLAVSVEILAVSMISAPATGSPFTNTLPCTSENNTQRLGTPIPHPSINNNITQIAKKTGLDIPVTRL
jgi:hypothetical protein